MACFRLQDMEWCQDYAMHNRRFMQAAMVEAVNEVTGSLPDMDHSINIHHNYCSCERCSYQVLGCCAWTLACTSGPC